MPTSTENVLGLSLMQMVHIKSTSPWTWTAIGQVTFSLLRYLGNKLITPTTYIDPHPESGWINLVELVEVAEDDCVIREAVHGTCCDQRVVGHLLTSRRLGNQLYWMILIRGKRKSSVSVWYMHWIRCACIRNVKWKCYMTWVIEIAYISDDCMLTVTNFACNLIT